MAWVKIDDQFPQHPKIIRAGPLGMALQVAALCYANRYLTDGFIPKDSVPLLLSFNGTYPPDVLAAKLVEVGIWTQAPGGYQIHDYDKYQPTKAQVLAERERNRRAGHLSATQRSTLRQHSVEHPANTTPNALSTSPDPDPGPDPGSRSRAQTPKKETLPAQKKRFGEFINVILSESEYSKLITRFSETGTQERIEALSQWLASTGKHRAGHYATILNWERMHKKEQDRDGKSSGTHGSHQGSTRSGRPPIRDHFTTLEELDASDPRQSLAPKRPPG